MFVVAVVVIDMPSATEAIFTTSEGRHAGMYDFSSACIGKPHFHV
jgi:hypothetical protein